MNSHRLLPLFVAASILAGCRPEETPASKPGNFLSDPSIFATSSDWSPERAPLIFMSNRSGNADIYRIDPGDTTWVNLTLHESEDNWPDWSPDASRIVFHSDRNGKFDVFVMNADGSELRQLTTHDDHDYIPSWTPDGRIVFTSWRQEPEDSVRAQHVFVMNADGSDQRRLKLAGGAPVTGAVFSADGRTIVYGREMDGRAADLYLASMDDLEGTLITDSKAYYGDPAFSPDGRWLVYYASHEGSSDLLVRDLESATIDTALTGGSHFYGRFSPDGRWLISCTETGHANYDVLYFPVDGSMPPHPLVATDGRECEGRWAPVAP